MAPGCTLEFTVQPAGSVKVSSCFVVQPGDLTEEYEPTVEEMVGVGEVRYTLPCTSRGVPPSRPAAPSCCAAPVVALLRRSASCASCLVTVSAAAVACGGWGDVVIEMEDSFLPRLSTWLWGWHCAGGRRSLAL